MQLTQHLPHHPLSLSITHDFRGYFTGYYTFYYLFYRHHHPQLLVIRARTEVFRKVIDGDFSDPVNESNFWEVLSREFQNSPTSPTMQMQ